MAYGFVGVGCARTTRVVYISCSPRGDEGNKIDSPRSEDAYVTLDSRSVCKNVLAERIPLFWGVRVSFLLSATHVDGFVVSTAFHMAIVL